MRRLVGLLSLFGALAFVACQQTQEAADGDGEDTTVIEKETVVQPAEEPSDGGMEMDVQMEDGEVSGEVKVEEN